MKHIIAAVSIFFGTFAISPLTAICQKTTSRSGTLQEVIGGMEQADEKVDAIYDLDVFSYFDFGDDYPETDLKKEVYRKTPEYKERLSELQKKKAQLANTDYYVKADRPFESNNYDVKRRGFDIALGENWGEGTMSARAPKSISGFLFPPLPTKNYPQKEFGQGIYEERLFLPVNEEAGLQIENDPDKVAVYFIFRVNDKQTVHFKFESVMSDGSIEWYVITQKLLYADRVRVLIANEETGDIYFDKLYKSK